MTPPATQSSADVALFIADSMEGLNNNTNLQLTAVSREQPANSRAVSDSITPKPARQNSASGSPKSFTDTGSDLKP